MEVPVTLEQERSCVHSQLLAMMVRDMGMTYERAITLIFADTGTGLAYAAAAAFRDLWGSEETIRATRSGRNANP